jgi:hypothetical protein
VEAKAVGAKFKPSVDSMRAAEARFLWLCERA